VNSPSWRSVVHRSELKIPGSPPFPGINVQMLVTVPTALPNSGPAAGVFDVIESIIPRSAF
jgi:hypothetical protein